MAETAESKIVIAPGFSILRKARSNLESRKGCRSLYSTPSRIQRKRSKGWRKPPNTSCVDRSSRWGNPFKIGVDGTLEEVLRKYRVWIKQKLNQDPDFLTPLRGRNLACFCELTEPCHADILLQLANGQSKQQSHRSDSKRG
jgi:hypothetical protein